MKGNGIELKNLRGAGICAVPSFPTTAQFRFKFPKNLFFPDVVDICQTLCWRYKPLMKVLFRGFLPRRKNEKRVNSFSLKKKIMLSSVDNFSK